MIGVAAWIIQSRTARTGLAIAAILGGLFVWHKADKSSALRRAVVEYVAKVELIAARVELEEGREYMDFADGQYLAFAGTAGTEIQVVAMERVD